MKKVKVGVIGATGFTGEKLIELLLRHPKVEIKYLSAKLDKELKFSQVFPKFKNRLDLVCKNLNLTQAANSADILFLALPHRISLEIAPVLLKKQKLVIDLSADYRLKDPKVYQKFYQTVQKDKANLKKAVYGLPEFFRDKIKKAKLIANPGCYPTVSALSLAPLVKENLIKNIIVDAKSGISGVGRQASLKYHYVHLNGNLFSYKPFDHQHLPEINQTLTEIAKRKVEIRFTPHVIPAERGILATIYGSLTKSLSLRSIGDIYSRYYKNEPFVRLLKQGLPELKSVVETNFCDIGFQVQGQDIVIVGVIDNLIKGASGQAIQNMNILLSLPEVTGLL
jgi:N-acetyl-gamma-glutamyl-phosphate reductase